jgi:6-pyruvoyltetrahydropterin/6-carboxytetrahydropterin synthase
MFELSKQFRFEAAHTLERQLDAEPSRRILRTLSVHR